MKIKLAVASALLSLGVSMASAAPLVPNEDNDGVPDLNDAVNLLTGSAFGSNADIASLKIDDLLDQAFILNTLSTPIVGLTAANSNTLGYYSDLGTGAVQNSTGTTVGSTFGFTGDGSNGNPFTGAEFSPDPGAAPVGFYLQSDNGSVVNTFFSQDALNPGGIDHMIAYDLSSLGPISVWANFGGDVREVVFEVPVLIGWEDILGGGDADYDDAIYLVDATPIPLPAGGLLLLTGLAGLAAARRRKKS